MTGQQERRLRRIEQELGLVKLLIGLFMAAAASTAGWVVRSWDPARWITWAGMVLAMFLMVATREWIVEAYRLVREMEKT